MSKRWLAFLIVSATINGCTSCCEDINVVTVSLGHCALAVNNLDNRGETPILSVDQRVPRAAFGLELALSTTEDVCLWRGMPNPFLSTALATGCFAVEATEVVPLDTITAIRITTLRQFDDSTEVGTDVSDRFVAYTQSESFEPIPEFLTGSVFFDAATFLTFDETPVVERIRLLSRRPLPAPGEQQFEVSIALSDGRTLTATSPVVTLQ